MSANSLKNLGSLEGICRTLARSWSQARGLVSEVSARMILGRAVFCDIADSVSAGAAISICPRHPFSESDLFAGPRNASVCFVDLTKGLHGSVCIQPGVFLCTMGVMMACGGTVVFADVTTDSSAVVTRTYDIRDLIGQFPLSSKPDFTANGILTATPWAPDVEVPEDRAQDIVTKIQTTVDFNSWNTVGRISEKDGDLTVTNSVGVQRDIENLLGKLREARSLCVTVNARFIAVGYQATGIYEMLDAASAANPKPGIGGSKPLSASTATEGLISACKEAKDVHVIESTIDMPNGAGGYSVQGGSFTYVTKMEEIRDGDKVIYCPHTACCTFGAMLNVVNSVVSADHHYVTVDLRPEWSQPQWRTRAQLDADGKPKSEKPAIRFTDDPLSCDDGQWRRDPIRTADGCGSARSGIRATGASRFPADSSRRFPQTKKRALSRQEANRQ